MMGCLVISHGKIAEALVSASHSIAGPCDCLFTLQLENLSPKKLREKIIHLIETQNFEDGLFILVSLRGGSFWNVALGIAKEHHKVQIISGLNLSTILSFITKHDKYSFDELGEILQQDTVRGISRYAH